MEVKEEGIFVPYRDIERAAKVGLTLSNPAAEGVTLWRIQNSG